MWLQINIYKIKMHCSFLLTKSTCWMYVLLSLHGQASCLHGQASGLHGQTSCFYFLPSFWICVGNCCLCTIDRLRKHDCKERGFHVGNIQYILWESRLSKRFWNTLNLLNDSVMHGYVNQRKYNQTKKSWIA